MMALARTDTAIVVRMPSRDAAAAGRVLDAGAHGVIFPMIETPHDAGEAVEACRIYPGGRRSFGKAGSELLMVRFPEPSGQRLR
jgi:4-hydroxy-2-oxoheptanedioate aldolase